MKLVELEFYLSKPVIRVTSYNDDIYYYFDGIKWMNAAGFESTQWVKAFCEFDDWDYYKEKN